jgi:hypothetical protein
LFSELRKVLPITFASREGKKEKPFVYYINMRYVWGLISSFLYGTPTVFLSRITVFQLMMSEEKERAVEEARVLAQEVMLLAAGRTIASKHKDTKFSHLVNFHIVAKHSVWIRCGVGGVPDPGNAERN